MAPAYPCAQWATNFGAPWWRDARFVVGRLTNHVRRVRVVNMLASQAQLLDVCEEETIREIENRYARWNKHTTSYTWKYNGVCVNMEETMAANGLEDETAVFHALSINERDPVCIPELHVYYNDDLSEF